MKNGWINSLAEFLSRHPKITFIGILIYWLTPIDLIPEALAGPLGFVDDILVLTLGLWLRRIAQTKKSNSSSPSEPIDTTARED